ncbi:hypothetical protein [Bacillus toyonensis]|uniref:hypothetical protein n=1 Tax=Bacillus toyonensis TaxID=155322 RepID=UPI001156074F|nr:hypothetical protein [Bacillus toyonensis]
MRRDERVALGNGKRGSSLQEELKNIVSDFEKAGFSKETIKGNVKTCLIKLYTANEKNLH